MVTYRDLAEQIRSFSEGEARLFSAACALRASVIVDGCATAETSSAYHRLLELAWSGDREEVKRELLSLLETAPEQEAESSGEIFYLPNHALQMITEAVHIGGSGDPIQHSLACCALGLDMATEFDAVIFPAPGGKEPALPVIELYERLELDAQQEAIDILRREQALEATKTMLEYRARSVMARVAEGLPAYLREFQ